MDRESILASVKKLLGIMCDYDVFDMDLIIHINSALAVLQQLGIGKNGFYITGENETWEDYLGEREENWPNVDMVKSYVYMKVRLIFDPPSSTAVIEAYNKTISEFEWRANVGVETVSLGGTSPDAD